MKNEGKSFGLTKEEAEAVYKIVKEYEKDAPESDKEYYDDYYDEYKTPLKKKIIKSIIKKLGPFLPVEDIRFGCLRMAAFNQYPFYNILDVFNSGNFINIIFVFQDSHDF